MIPQCEVRMRHRDAWDVIDIWFIEYHHDRTADVHYPDGSKIKVKEAGHMSEPSLSLSRRTMDSLLQAAMEEVIPNHQMHTHLKDAIATRDRLLTIVERVIK